MNIRQIDHICFAVRDLREAKKVYGENLGVVPAVEYEAESEHIRVARYYIGEVAVELIEATSPDGEVAKFIEKRGEGVFLISYRVDNLDSAMEELKGKGAKLIDDKPRHLFGNRYAFIQKPSELGGVLTELLDGEFDKGLITRG